MIANGYPWLNLLLLSSLRCHRHLFFALEAQQLFLTILHEALLQEASVGGFPKHITVYN